MEPFRLHKGDRPLLVSMPHVGTYVPQAIAGRMTELARQVPDTDWHVEQLYDFLDALGASILVATHSRYVTDLNRPPDDAPLYPGAASTGLCPSLTFDGEPLYRPGAGPEAAEVAERRTTYWQPYHAALAGELARLKERHGRVLLWEAHSIRSRVPRLFEGRLKDLNLGSADGRAASPGLIAAVSAVAETSSYSSILDGRFKGGYITRAYGRPEAGVEALQLELAQSTYMEEAPPFTFREELAAKLRPTLRRLLETALSWLEEHQASVRTRPS